MKHRTAPTLIVGAVLAACLQFSQTIEAQTLPIYDPLGYPAGVRLGAGDSVTVWNIGNSPGTGSPEFSAAAALTYADMPASSGLGVVSTWVPGSNRDRGIGFDLVTFGEENPVLYASFLLNIQAGPVANDRFLAAFRQSGTSGGFSNPAGGLFVTPDLELGLSKADLTVGAGKTSALSLDTTYLVVLGYQWIDGAGNDEVSVWINPVPSGSPVPADLTLSAGSDVNNAGAFVFPLRSAAAQNGGGTYWLDEVRIGTSWIDVAPVPEPSTYALFGVSLFGLAVWRRLRRQS